MNLSDVVQNLIDKLIFEKEQNFILQQQIIAQQKNQTNEEQKNKDLL